MGLWKKRQCQQQMEIMPRHLDEDLINLPNAAPPPSYMRLLFRDARIGGSVVLGKRTVKEGEALGVWNLQGRYSTIVGPKRKWMFMSRFRFFDRFVADSKQYLIIAHRDGRKEHRRGPTSLFHDPVLYESVSVANAVTVDAYEKIIVYTEDQVGNVKRSIVSGPTIFVPDTRQWLHTFKWHGSPSRDNSDAKGNKVPGALVFTKLRTIPDQFYYNAQDVRTSDDASLTIKVMVFFCLIDIDTMLNQTHDPIGDFINALLADLMNFSSRHTYESFIASTQRLSDLETYPVTCARATAVGFKITKVVYRGYTASKALQELCDSAIKSRTELKLKQEAAEAAQRLKDMELRSMIARGAEEREAEAAKQAHRLQLESAAAREALTRSQESALEAQAQKDRATQAEARVQQESYCSQLKYLAGLKELGVDVTRYLVANAERHPDRVLRLQGLPEGGSLHAHVNC